MSEAHDPSSLGSILPVTPAARESIEGLSASLISRKHQQVGQHILSNDRLVEVEENVFSTCQEPIEDFARRLLRARDTGVVLVEATIFPQSDMYQQFKNLFGITNGLVKKLLRSDGVEHPNGLHGAFIEFEEVALPTEMNGNLGLFGANLKEVQATLGYGTYKSTAHWFSLSRSYEHELAFGMVPPTPNRSGMDEALDRISIDFEIAIMRDGSIDSCAVELPPEPRQLSAG